MTTPDDNPALLPLALPAEPVTETCAWPAVYVDCDGGDCADVYASWDDPAAAQKVFEALASDLLWNWTNEIFGVCGVVVRPCRADCDGGRSFTSTFWGRGPGYDPSFPRYGTGAGFHNRSSGHVGPWLPVLLGGSWFNVTCGVCLTHDCTCEISGANAINLPGPVQSIDSVLVDGVVVPPSSYRVANKRTLIRTDGEAWPGCQDLSLPSSEPNTFEVTYQKGTPVPIGGQVAVGRLACELAKEACDDDSCALPANITNLTRQGISAGFDDTWEKQQEGWTGIRSIDTWVSSIRGKARPFASVRSPDVKPTPR